MHKKFILYLITISFLITSCGGNDWAAIKRGVTGAKSNDTDEFLVKKKDPLILPPDFESLPTPGDRRSAKQEISIFEETLGETAEEDDSSKSIEQSILKKIQKQ
mgnify:FL=1